MKTAIIIGAGDRGRKVYGRFAENNPLEMSIVGIAEPNPYIRKDMQKVHGIEDENAAESYEALLSKGKIADAAIITTLDKMHHAPVIQAIEAGYDILLEKPISPDVKECVEIADKAEANGVSITVCHVLRYTEFWSTIKKIIDSGEIGDVASVQLNENVEFMHMSHSFVRGNWGNKEKSSPMILQKSCHDMDIISFILDKKCERVSSFGSLMHFNEENAPEGAPKRCLEGCPAADSCPYHAGRYYLGEGRGWAGKFTNETTDEEIIEALWNTDYGKCVYRHDNNVVDHQVVNMEFEGGATATFSMCGFTREQTRICQIMGTKGEIRGNMSDNTLSIYDFLSGHEKIIKLPSPVGGHGGGDYRLMRGFIKALDSGEEMDSSIEKSLQSHLMAFAAEESRLSKGRSIELSEMRGSVKL